MPWPLTFFKVKVDAERGTTILRICLLTWCPMTAGSVICYQFSGFYINLLCIGGINGLPDVFPFVDYGKAKNLNNLTMGFNRYISGSPKVGAIMKYTGKYTCLMTPFVMFCLLICYTPSNEVLGLYRNHPVCPSVPLSVHSKLNLGYDFWTKRYCTCVFLVTRPFSPYQKFDLVALTLTFDLLLKKLNLRHYFLTKRDGTCVYFLWQDLSLGTKNFDLLT